MMKQIQYTIAKYLGFPMFFASKSDIQKLISMAKDIGDVGLEFEITHNQRGWVAQCIQNRCISTGGIESDPTSEEISDAVKDAIFTAYDIPAYLCNPNLLLNESEMIQTIKRRSSQSQFTFNSNFAYASG